MRQDELLRLLIHRLERLSVDSHWARRASGIRGNLLKMIEILEQGGEVETSRLDALIEKAFDVLRRSAQEIPDVEAMKR